MVHHQSNVLLGKIIRRSAFGDNAPDQSMVVLRRTFLARSLRITVEYPGSALPM